MHENLRDVTPDQAKTQEQLESEQEVLEWEELVVEARQSLMGFTCATKNNYVPNWHHRALSQIMERVLSGELKRVIINMPPQNGKSELISRRLPPYAFGKNPNLRIIAGTYGSDLAAKNNLDVQRIMDTELYRAIFPHSTIPGSYAETYEGRWKRNSKEFNIVNREGYYRCAGVGGAITGFGADLLVLDDLFKNREEADSLTVREKVWDWFTSTARTRLSQNGAIILLMTRWHQDDTVGRIEHMMKTIPGFDNYRLFNFPAIAAPEVMNNNEYDNREYGEPLWPTQFSMEYLQATKASSGSRDWNAIYQGSPVSAAGSVFKRSWFKFYRELPSAHMEKIISVDLSFEDKKTSSYTVMQAWARDKANLYLVDQVRDLMNFPAQKAAITSFCAKHPEHYEKVIEHKANGAALIAELKNQIVGLIPFNPKGSKMDRAKAASPAVEAGNVYLPHPDNAPWVHDLIDELCNFPTGRYEDQVDTFSQAILRYRTGSVGEFTQQHVPQSKAGTFANRTRMVSKW